MSNSEEHNVIRLNNKHLDHLDSDYLMHLGVPNKDPEILSKFHGVKYVCTGGTASRMKQLALLLVEETNHRIRTGSPFDYVFESERCCGYLVGPVLCVSHGIGLPSLSVILHETFKLLRAAKSSDVTLIRVGTSGGIGVPPGTVVVSKGALTAGFEPYYNTSCLGKHLSLPAIADMDLVKALCECRRNDDPFQTISAMTYCADDFFQGQGRLDGSFCDYSKADSDEFLRKLQDLGVRNIEMESAGVLGMAHKVGIKAAVVCAVLVDRLESELPQLTSDEAKAVQNNSLTIVIRYIKQKLAG